VPPDWDTSLFQLVQDERERGIVFSVSDGGTCHYTEYWYLYPEYIYPGRDSGASITVTAMKGSYDGPDAFAKAMRELHPGGTLVTVDNVEHRRDCR
jgi:hypothetical protein